MTRAPLLPKSAGLVSALATLPPRPRLRLRHMKVFPRQLLLSPPAPSPTTVRRGRSIPCTIPHRWWVSVSVCGPYAPCVGMGGTVSAPCWVTWVGRWAAHSSTNSPPLLRHHSLHSRRRPRLPLRPFPLSRQRQRQLHLAQHQSPHPRHLLAASPRLNWNLPASSYPNIAPQAQHAPCTTSALRVCWAAWGASSFPMIRATAHVQAGTALTGTPALAPRLTPASLCVCRCVCWVLCGARVCGRNKQPSNRQVGARQAGESRRLFEGKWERQPGPAARFRLNFSV